MYIVITVEYVRMLVINSFFYLQVKNEPCVHWAYAFIPEYSANANTNSEHFFQGIKLNIKNQP
jgi:hypothetical protein